MLGQPRPPILYCSTRSRVDYNLLHDFRIRNIIVSKWACFNLFSYLALLIPSLSDLGSKSEKDLVQEKNHNIVKLHCSDTAESGDE
jgi:hypothetical protein